MIKSIFPILETRDVASTLDLYCNWLGFQRAGSAEEEANGLYAVHSGSVYLAFIHSASVTPGVLPGRGVRFYFETDDVEERYELAQRAGFRMVYPLGDKPYRMREFTIQDPNGYLLTFAQEIPNLR